MLKKLFLPFFLLMLSVSTRAQQDASLKVRLDSMMLVTKASDIDKILDYTYPKLFTIATREQLAEAMSAAFETEEYSSSLDSVEVIKIYPVFNLGAGQYAKIKHSMLMRMKFRDPIDDEQAAQALTEMEASFGKGNLRFDKPANTFVISIISAMLAIKDEFSSEWSFVNYSGDDQMVKLLFSKELIEKLQEYK